MDGLFFMRNACYGNVAATQPGNCRNQGNTPNPPNYQTSPKCTISTGNELNSS
jgi:hypothetical protein